MKTGDIIELIVNIPERGLLAGEQGTIVHCHSDSSYEAEFMNEHGETIDFLALRTEQFIVVWRVDTQAWVPLTDLVSALITKMPQESAQEVFDFARFLSWRSRVPALEKAAFELAE
ncbi:MAG: DUF4926 domain-containing protein [candidate division KSB1 bacterium]